MRTIHIRVLRKTAKSGKWETLEHDGDQIQEVPVREDETPETADCTEFVMETLCGMRLYPNDRIRVQRVAGRKLQDYTPAVRYTKSLTLANGWTLWTGRDAIGRRYAGLPVKIDGGEGHLVIEVSTAEMEAFLERRTTIHELFDAGRKRPMHTSVRKPSRADERVMLERYKGTPSFPEDSDKPSGNGETGQHEPEPGTAPEGRPVDTIRQTGPRV